MRSAVPPIGNACHAAVECGRLSGAELRAFADQLPDWKLMEERHIPKTFPFLDFRQGPHS